LRVRIVIAMLLVLAAKAVTLVLPLLYKRVVDTMAGDDPLVWLAMGLVLAYAAGRFASVAFDNIRNIVFERVGQDATRHLAEDVFGRLHQLSLRFHLSRRTGRSHQND
jgi:ATP-binding cassette subfamily B protein